MEDLTRSLNLEMYFKGIIQNASKFKCRSIDEKCFNRRSIVMFFTSSISLLIYTFVFYKCNKSTHTLANNVLLFLVEN